MAREKILEARTTDAERLRDAALRPKLLSEVIGQRKVVQRLQIAA